MTKIEFAISFASEAMRSEYYAEDPSGLYEYVKAMPEKFVPYVNFALKGLNRFNKPITYKTLSEQFSYVLHQWASGAYETGEDGKVHCVRDEENRKRLEMLNREAYRAHRSKGYYDKEPVQKHWEFIYGYAGSEDGWYDYDIHENFVGTAEEAETFRRHLLDCGYYNVSVFCQEDEM